jgi:hypothetical protein
MFAFDDIKPGSRLRGLDAAGIAEVVRVSRFGADALNLVFRVQGRIAERLVYRGEEKSFELVEAGRAYAFDADGGLLRLASEAYRIRLAHLFDPYLAVSASQIEALPHQITAVYGEMLPRQPLRFLLADDPGAGKTIMAGLLIKELLIRGDLERCLIVAPGNLVEQWQDEMAEKFGLGFDPLTRDQIESSITGNPFVERSRLIARLDMLARSDELRAAFLRISRDRHGAPGEVIRRILNAVVMELQRNPSAKVKITLEIEAEAPSGFSEANVGVVRDNARQLKFKAGSTGFE